MDEEKKFKNILLHLSNSKNYGPVHEYIEKTGIDFGVLRPTWFHGQTSPLESYCGSDPCLLENFGAAGVFLEEIRDSSTLSSAFGDGKMPFISCDDIAEGAFDMFAAEVPPNTDRLVLGPKLYSMDEVSKSRRGI